MSMDYEGLIIDNGSMMLKFANGSAVLITNETTIMAEGNGSFTLYPGITDMLVFGGTWENLTASVQNSIIVVNDSISIKVQNATLRGSNVHTLGPAFAGSTYISTQGALMLFDNARGTLNGNPASGDLSYNGFNGKLEITSKNFVEFNGTAGTLLLIKTSADNVTVNPGGSVIIDYTVFAESVKPAEISVEAPFGWRAELTGVAVNITVPSATLGGIYEIILKAKSGEDVATKTVNINVPMIRSLSAFGVQNRQSYTLYFFNNGNTKETLNLTITMGTGRLSRETLQIEAGEFGTASISFEVNYTIPNSTAYLFLVQYIASDGGVDAFVAGTYVVPEIYGVEFTTPENIISKSGEITAFNITVNSKANVPDTYTIEIATPSNWTVNYTKEFYINPGGNQTVEIIFNNSGIEGDYEFAVNVNMNAGAKSASSVVNIKVVPEIIILILDAKDKTDKATTSAYSANEPVVATYLSDVSYNLHLLYKNPYSNYQKNNVAGNISVLSQIVSYFDRELYNWLSNLSMDLYNVNNTGMSSSLIKLADYMDILLSDMQALENYKSRAYFIPEIKKSYCTALYVRDSIEKDVVTDIFERNGYLITDSYYIPAEMSIYGVVYISNYRACYQETANYVKNYLKSGGGVILVGGSPCYFSYSTSSSSNVCNKNMGGIAEWFGASWYDNRGGYAHVALNNPLGTSLTAGDLLHYSSSPWAAAVFFLNPNSTVLATWDAGGAYAFIYEYQDGRVFYHAGVGSQSPATITLAEAGINWAANAQNSCAVCLKIENRTHKVKLVNLGKNNSEYYLNILGLPENWTFFMPSSVYVPSGSEKEFFINITPPENLKPGLFYFTLEVSSLNDSRAKYFIKSPPIIFVNCNSDVKLKLSPKKLELYQNESSSFNVTIENLGNSTDNFSLLIEGLPDNWLMTKTVNVSIGNKSNTTLNFTLKIPENYPPENITFGAFAASTTNVSVSAGDYGVISVLKNEIATEKRVSLSVSPEVLEVNGSFEEFVIELKNTGTIEDTYRLLLKNLPQNWSYKTEDLHSLLPGQSKKIILEVFPNSLKIKSEIEIMVMSESDSNVNVAKNITVINKRVTGVELSLSPLIASASRESAVTFNLTVSNSGKIEDTFDIFVEGLPAAWNYSIENGTVSLPPFIFNSKNITLTLYVPANATAGEYNFTAVASSRSNINAKNWINGTIIVTEYSVAIEIMPYNISAAPGMPLQFEISVKNLGTINDTYELSSDVLPGKFDITTVALFPNETAITVLTVENTSYVSAGTYPLKVNAASLSEPSARDTATAYITFVETHGVNFIVIPDSISAHENESVNYLLMIQNTGNMPDTLTLRVFADNFTKVSTAQTGIFLNSHSTGFILLTASAISGNHTIKVQAASDKYPTVTATAFVELIVPLQAPPPIPRSPRQFKVDTISKLEAVKTGDGKTSKLINRIVELINASLYDNHGSLWIDNWHIVSDYICQKENHDESESESKENEIEGNSSIHGKNDYNKNEEQEKHECSIHGLAVFHQEHAAAVLINESEQNNLSALFEETVLELATADKLLVATAIREAEDMNISDNNFVKEIEKAIQDFNGGSLYLANKDPARAIKLFESAWKHIRQAIHPNNEERN